jgi:50S ribosomal subunit-associated GTPase HflX
VKATLPYHAGALVQQIRTRGSLKSVDYEEAGIRIDASVPPELAAEIQAAVRRR